MRVAKVKSSVNDNYHPHMKTLSSWDITTYEGDIFTSNEGHFVGDDGFVIPNSFEEMEQRYPNYVRNWVCRRLQKMPFDSMVEDWTSELSLFLRSLPPTSKMKARGFKDVVDVYNPWSSFGASAKRFFGYINRCLANKHFTICVKQKKDALNSFSVIPYHGGGNSDARDPLQNEEITESTSYEGYIVDQSAYIQEMMDKEDANIYKAIFVERFVDFVEQQRPELLATARAIMNEEKVDNPAQFQRDKRALISLGKNYLKGSYANLG